MSVLLETALGDLVIDLYHKERPRCSLNFLKLCKLKYYNWSLFDSIQADFVAKCGAPATSPTSAAATGASVFKFLYGDQAELFEVETMPKINHTKRGLISMVNNGHDMHGSQFFITLANGLDYLDGVHTVFGEVAEGLETLEKLNSVICDGDHRPYQDIRIGHTLVIEDPFDDPPGLEVPSRSPSPSPELLKHARLNPGEELDDDAKLAPEKIRDRMEAKEAKARAHVLEMIGDLHHADEKPPDNVLFVCKLNPVTTEDDLNIIFSRFGAIKEAEIIRDKKSGKSLQYAFIEFENPKNCENAYFKMDNVLIDDRRIHVDFSQSVAKNYQWKKQTTVNNEETKRPNPVDSQSKWPGHQFPSPDSSTKRSTTTGSSNRQRSRSPRPSRGRRSREHNDVPDVRHSGPAATTSTRRPKDTNDYSSSSRVNRGDCLAAARYRNNGDGRHDYDHDHSKNRTFHSKERRRDSRSRSRDRGDYSHDIGGHSCDTGGYSRDTSGHSRDTGGNSRDTGRYSREHEHENRSDHERTYSYYHSKRREIENERLVGDSRNRVPAAGELLPNGKNGHRKYDDKEEVVECQSRKRKAENQSSDGWDRNGHGKYYNEREEVVEYQSSKRKAEYGSSDDGGDQNFRDSRAESQDSATNKVGRKYNSKLKKNKKEKKSHKKLHSKKAKKLKKNKKAKKQAAENTDSDSRESY